MASFEKKSAEAEASAAAIVAEARAQAEQLNVEAAERLKEFIARRTKQAEAKIALAEAQASAEVRAAAAEHAARAAEIVLTDQMKGPAAPIWWRTKSARSGAASLEAPGAARGPASCRDLRRDRVAWPQTLALA